MTFYAHTASRPDGSPDPDKSRWQPLYTGDAARPGHLENVARLAAEFASAFGGADWAYLAGLWHDLGKHSVEFQQYLVSAADPETEHSPAHGPDHSTAGAQHASRSLPLFGTLLAYIIAGHHSGLPNGIDATQSCLEERLRNDDIPKLGAIPLEISAPPRPPPHPPGSALMSGYALGLFLRMSFSALVDADWLNTEASMTPGRAADRQCLPQLTLVALRDCLDTYLARFGRPNTPVRQARADVLAACRSAAQQPPGLFSLTVPTGGGKTLSSLAFALDHD